jgi:hypothetical protein
MFTPVTELLGGRFFASSKESFLAANRLVSVLVIGQKLASYPVIGSYERALKRGCYAHSLTQCALAVTASTVLRA